MDNQNNVWGWVIGIIVVVIVVGGLWWYFSGASTGMMQNGTATTTAAMATTTDSSGVATEDRSGSTVADVVASLGDASQAQALFTSTGVMAGLTGKGPYTVFVPEDEAFANVAPGTLANMTAAQKLRTAQYHIVVGKQLDDNAVASGAYQALSKDSLNFSVTSDNGSAYVNSGLIVKEYKASNGIVYVTSAVLIPPTPANPVTGH